LNKHFKNEEFVISVDERSYGSYTPTSHNQIYAIFSHIPTNHNGFPI